VEPWDAADPLDVAACERKLEFSIGWFADPIYFGRYPASVEAQIGDRLPRFTADEAAMIRGSNDYYGMNHYCANYIKHNPGPAPRDDIAGNLQLLMENCAGESIGPETQSAWLRPYPVGFRRLLLWLSRRYGGPAIFVTENGTSVKGESDLPLADALKDEFRSQYFRDYISTMADARNEDGVNVVGYLAWSLLE
jgi:beta-glucosidase